MKKKTWKMTALLVVVTGILTTTMLGEDVWNCVASWQREWNVKPRFDAARKQIEQWAAEKAQESETQPVASKP